MARRGSSVSRVALASVALLAVVLTGGSLPHVHLGGEPGFWNHDHDLAYLATFSSGAAAPDQPSAAPFVAPARLAAARTAPAPVTAPRRHADFRAPPSR